MLSGIFADAMNAFHASVAAALLSVLPACANNLHAVEEHRVYRAAQPDGYHLRTWIWRYDLETVVRLRGGDAEDEDYGEETDAVEAAGIDFVQVPLSATRFPDKAQLLNLCEVFDGARYPLLLHCRAGADRAGMASAIYVLMRTSDLALAREQLALLPYGHTGWGGTSKLDEVLDMYEPWHAVLPFREWVRQVYERPENDELPDSYFEEQSKRAEQALGESPFEES